MRMKTKSKALLLTLCAVLLVTASVLGTIAYLTSTDTVENTFTVGSVEISMDEAAVNPDGTVIANADRVRENSYHLLPGHPYTKDPIIHVGSDSEDCWIFVKVENGISDIEAGTTIANQLTTNGWTAVSGTTDIFAYQDIVSKDTDIPVVGSFTISGDVDADDLAEYEDAEIIVTAYAVQTALRPQKLPGPLQILSNSVFHLRILSSVK